MGWLRCRAALAALAHAFNSAHPAASTRPAQHSFYGPAAVLSRPLHGCHHHVHPSRRSFSSLTLRPHLDLRSLTQPATAARMKQNIVDRGLHVDLDAILQLHHQCGQLQYEAEQLRSERNRLTAAIGRASSDERQRRIDEGKAVKERLRGVEERLEVMKERLEDEGLRLPNVMQPETPIGPEGSGRVIEHIGTARQPHNSQSTLSAAYRCTQAAHSWLVCCRLSVLASFSFQPRDHVALATLHDLLDFPAAAQTTGSRFVFLKHELALLELALVNYTMHQLVRHQFTPLTPPDLVRSEYVWATGYQPRIKQGDRGGREVYGVDGGLALVGTAEIPMAGYYVNAQFTPYSSGGGGGVAGGGTEAQFPIQHCGFSHCFRVEAGGLGQQHRGLYRLHQFSKVEMFTLALPHQSTAAFDHILSFQRSLLSSLGLYARALEVPSGDLGASASRKVDMEVWMLGGGGGGGGSVGGSVGGVVEGRWGEVSSASRCEDYQSRRLNVRFKDAERGSEAAEAEQDGDGASDKKQKSGGGGGRWRYVHTLNGTACAVPRLMIGIMEQKQRADGSIAVPECLQPYMMGIDVIPSPMIKRTHTNVIR